MSTILDGLEQAQFTGERAYGESALARDLDPTLRRIGRRRAARSAGGGAVAVGAVGAAAFALWALPERGGELLPGASPSATVSTPGPSPSPSALATLPAEVTVEVLARTSVEMALTRWEAGLEVRSTDSDIVVNSDDMRTAIIAALPPEAQGNPEGWLAPGTYTSDSLNGLAEQMVAATKDNLDAAGVAPGDYQRILTLASLITWEAKLDEHRKPVAQVIHNRLEAGMPLELASTLIVPLDEYEMFPDSEQRQLDSPYNTYRNAGLPPGPIAAPSAEDIETAVNPGQSALLYFVTVDPISEEMRFAETLAGHQSDVDVLRQWLTDNGQSGSADTLDR